MRKEIRNTKDERGDGKLAEIAKKRVHHRPIRVAAYCETSGGKHYLAAPISQSVREKESV